MNDLKDDIELRLAGLRVRTDSISPAPAFTDRVMQRIERERSRWLPVIPSLWRRAVSVAALLAILSAAWAYRNARSADERFAMAIDADDSTELDW